MDSDTALIRLKEAQKRYRERNRDKYNDYMRGYYKKRVKDDEYRKKRNEYRKKAYEKQKLIQKNAAWDGFLIIYVFSFLP